MSLESEKCCKCGKPATSGQLLDTRYYCREHSEEFTERIIAGEHKALWKEAEEAMKVKEES